MATVQSRRAGLAESIVERIGAGRRPMTKFSLLLCAALLLEACGGAGNVRVANPQSPPQLPEEEDPSPPGPPIEVSVSMTPSVSVTGPDPDRDTISYLGNEDARSHEFAKGRLPLYNPASEPPVVMLERGSESARDATERAVHAINRGLPDDWQITVAQETVPDDSYPETTRSGEMITHTLIANSPHRGAIFLQARPLAEWTFPAGYENPPDTSSSGSDIGYHRAFNIVSGPPYRYEGGKIWADSEKLNEAELSKTIAHELIHVLGRGHVNSNDRPRWSVMQTGRNTGHPEDILFPVDRGALQAIYATARGAIRFDSLEAELAGWDDDEYEVSGSFGPLSLGVWARYGVPDVADDLVKPWFSSNVAPSPVFEGSATWTGHLLGMTSEKDAIRGKAEIKLELGSESLHGRARFGELVSIESGDPWIEGELSYSLRGEGNRFFDPDGKIDGTIHGTRHEAVAGTLHEQGLVAAFGAVQ